METGDMAGNDKGYGRERVTGSVFSNLRQYSRQRRHVSEGYAPPLSLTAFSGAFAQHAVGLLNTGRAAEARAGMVANLARLHLAVVGDHAEVMAEDHFTAQPARQQ